MKQDNEFRFVKRVRVVGRATWSVAPGILCVCVVTVASVAGPPVQRLDPPFYSFDAESPSIDPAVDPVTGLNADDILGLRPDPAYPAVEASGADLGLGQDGDELDALSSRNSDVSPGEVFLLLFSMDERSVAEAQPDPELVGDNIPYNALQQAAQGQGAGDQFMALDQFDRSGPISRGGGSRALATSVQTRNAHNEGGTDFGGEPENGSRRAGGNRGEGRAGPQDDVSSMMLTGRSAGGLVEVYFSVKAGSPSLATLPQGGGIANGAYIFFNANAPDPATETALFASASQLGLRDPLDDIDAVIVFDTNGNGEFDGTDQVLFSLTGTSPSRLTITDHSAIGAAADVFQISFGDLDPSIYAKAENLGLGGLDQGEDVDNIGALDYVFCVIDQNPNPSDRDCARAYAIQGNSVPTVSEWGLILLTLCVLAAGSVVIRRTSRRVA